MTTPDERREAAAVLVDAAGLTDPRRRAYAIDAVTNDPYQALGVFRAARAHVHPLWTGDGPDPSDPYRTGGPLWERVQAAARVLGLPETEPAPAQVMTCVCCGRTAVVTDPQTSRGAIHFKCWNEHHSDPTGVWPPDHECAKS